MLEHKIEAIKIVSEIYEPLEHLNCKASEKQMWAWSKARARKQIKRIKDALPITKHHYWIEVEKALELI